MLQRGHDDIIADRFDGAMLDYACLTHMDRFHGLQGVDDLRGQAFFRHSQTKTRRMRSMLSLTYRRLFPCYFISRWSCFRARGPKSQTGNSPYRSWSSRRTGR